MSQATITFSLVSSQQQVERVAGGDAVVAQLQQGPASSKRGYLSDGSRRRYTGEFDRRLILERKKKEKSEVDVYLEVIFFFCLLRFSLPRSFICVLLSTMALAGARGFLPCRLPLNTRSTGINRDLLAFHKNTGYNCRKKPLHVRFSASFVAPPTSDTIAPAISLSEKAFSHLNKMRVDKNEDMCLRIGVKQGGCSGMSYTMEFENRANTRLDDSLIEYKGFTIVCDPKSLLYVYGMQLDFSDALIGGGFSFKNPNATKTCGCGKSFAAAGENVQLTENSNHCGS